jgi:hypothetical protein
MEYSLLHTLKPYSIALKTRLDNNFLVAMSEDLEICYLNEVAYEFFKLSDGKNSIEKIIEILLEEYEVSYDILYSDIMKIVRDLQWNKIIRLKV